MFTGFLVLFKLAVGAWQLFKYVNKNSGGYLMVSEFSNLARSM